MKWIGFIISLTAILAIIGLCWKLAGYRRAYFLTAFLTVLFFFIGFFYGPGIEKAGLLVQDIILYSMVILPIVLFALSVRNLYVKNTIPRMFTIANIVLSVGIILVMIFAAFTYTGGGIIG